MRIRTAIWTTVALMAAALASPAAAADAGFVYKTTYRHAKADPDGIWSSDALGGGTATIHEYELRSPQGDFLVSQIWNDDCSSSTCPTRLVRVGPGTRRAVLVDDMMHQIIPPNDPRFAGLSKSGPQAAYAQHPFRLSADGKTLRNGDLAFDVRVAE